MIILGIETTCDETGAAVLQRKNGRIQILSNILASSAPLQAKYGGVIPEQAAREQIKSIIPVIETAINDSRLTINKIDAIAVARGPGLIGSLLVGVETAKTLSWVWKKPLIPVNHLIGHFYANWITQGVPPDFPCLGLLVSGGHTDLVLFKNHGKYLYLGGTRDDAAGECFDKCARLLGLPYPGGPEISKLAAKGKDTYNLPRPMMRDFSSRERPAFGWDFSFSGLKTATANLLKTKNLPAGKAGLKLKTADLAASIEAAIVDVLVSKTILAAKAYNVKNIMIAGGVASNAKLRSALQLNAKRYTLYAKIHVPPAELCTDNGAMIASAAFFLPCTKDPLKLQVNPNLSLAT